MANAVVTTPSEELVYDVHTGEVHPYESRRYSSLRGEDMATRRQVLAAVTNATPLKKQKDKVITVNHIIRQPATSVDEVTNEEEYYLRTTFVCEEGAFSAGSKGIDIVVDNILDLLGDPNEWDEPQKFVVRAVDLKKGEALTLEVVE